MSAIIGRMSEARLEACALRAARPAAIASASRVTAAPSLLRWRTPPSLTPRALAAARADFVRTEIILRSA